MDLQVHISGMDVALDAYLFYCRKKLGQSVEYGATIKLNQGNRYLVAEIAKQVSNQNSHFSVQWKGETMAENLLLTNCVYAPQSGEERLQLVSTFNRFGSADPGPFHPCKKVLRGAGNMLQLFRKYFSDLVHFDSTVEYALEQIQFPDGDKTNIIQFQETDVEMLYKAVYWYNCMAGKKNSLIISGSPEVSKFQLAWLQPEKCTDLSFPTSRKIDDKVVSKWNAQLKIGFQEMAPPRLYKQALPAQNICYEIQRGSFTIGEWNDWKKIDVPSYYKEQFVYETDDTFYDARGESVNWISRIATLPRKEDLEVAAHSLTQWSGIGKVTTRTPSGYWMEIELPDFDGGHTTMDVRVTTAYNGHKGDAGFHLVPEQDTEVHVHKPSDWLQPVLLLSNVRSQNVVGAAPYWKLEDPFICDFTSWYVNLNDMATTAQENISMNTLDVIIAGLTGQANTLSVGAKSSVFIADKEFTVVSTTTTVSGDKMLTGGDTYIDGGDTTITGGKVYIS